MAWPRGVMIPTRTEGRWGPAASAILAISTRSAGHLIRDGIFDLQSRLSLEEVVVVVRSTINCHRAKRGFLTYLRRARLAHGGILPCGLLLNSVCSGVHDCRGRLPSIIFGGGAGTRNIPSPSRTYAAVRVCNNLNFDVARLIPEFFEEDAGFRRRSSLRMMLANADMKFSSLETSRIPFPPPPPQSLSTKRYSAIRCASARASSGFRERNRLFRAHRDCPLHDQWCGRQSFAAERFLASANDR